MRLSLFFKSAVFATATALLLVACKDSGTIERRGVVIYPSDVISLGLDEWESRIDASGINLIGIHAATFHEPLDTLKAFVESPLGKDFLALCKRKGVEVEYELHVLQLLLPRDLFDTHPEYFRMDSKGKRQRRYNMCFSCDKAYEAMQPQLEEMMKWLHPDTHRYFMWTDDVQDAFCHCEKCRNLTPSEQALTYENRLLGMLRKYDKKACVAHLAYVRTMEAPRVVLPAEGVFLEYAPISRDYSKPLTPEHLRVLEENLEVFPRESLHILEYWLDESMFSNWKKAALVPLPFDEQACRRDIVRYRHFGTKSITCFATWLNGDYLDKYGSVREAFSGYGRAFSIGESELSLVAGPEPTVVEGFHAPWSALDDNTSMTFKATAESLYFSFKVNEASLCIKEGLSDERDIEPEDRVELFFSCTKDMSVPYFGIEIDPLGRTLDYKCAYYREFDYDWSFPGVSITSSIGEGIYEVSAVFSRDVLKDLGIDASKGFWLGAFRDDFRPDGGVDWYSLRPTGDKEPDFQKPDILIPFKAI